jgi:chemotaxis protein CheX
LKTITDTPPVDHNREHWVPMLEVAVREVFELMLSCQLTASEGLSDGPLNMTSMVGLAGQLCGVMSIRCSREAAGLMASKMLGVEVSKVGPELCDGFGEICNMVAGNFKNKIAGLSDGCMLSVPTVITGNDYSLTPIADMAAIEVRLRFERMPIAVSLQVHS